MQYAAAHLAIPLLSILPLQVRVNMSALKILFVAFSVACFATVMLVYTHSAVPYMYVRLSDRRSCLTVGFRALLLSNTKTGFLFPTLNVLEELECQLLISI